MGKNNFHIVASFFDELAEYVASGIPLATALEYVRSPLVAAIQYGFKRGDSLSMSLEKQGVSPQITIVLAVAEKTGRADSAIQSIARYCRCLQAVRQEIIGQLLYPAIILCMSLGLLVFYLGFILPVLRPLVPESPPSFPWWLVFGSVTVVCGIAYRYQLRLFLLKHIPVVRHFFWMQFFMLLQLFHLINTYTAFEPIAQKLLYPESVYRFVYALKRGEILDKALAYAAAPEMYPLLIGRGLLCQEVGKAIDNCCVRAEQQFDQSLRTMRTLIEPIITIVMGVVVGCIAWSFFVPLMKVMQITAEA